MDDSLIGEMCRCHDVDGELRERLEEVNDLLHVQSRGAEHPSKLRLAIAAANVLLRSGKIVNGANTEEPQIRIDAEMERRDGEDQLAPRPQDSGDLADDGGVVLDMFEDFRTKHGADRPAAQRQCIAARLNGPDGNTEISSRRKKIRQPRIDSNGRMPRERFGRQIAGSAAQIERWSRGTAQKIPNDRKLLRRGQIVLEYVYARRDGFDPSR